MKSLNEDLKVGIFKQMYLLFGEENYLKKQYKERLSTALVSPDDTMNYGYYEGKNINTKELIDIAETMPFFGERRLLVIENSGFFKNATEDMAEYLQNLPETTYFLFVESEVDKRGKMYKTLQKKGRAVELGHQDTNTLTRWLAMNARKEGFAMDTMTAGYLISKVGMEMETLSREMEKLIGYTWEKKSITREDVDAICITQVTNEIFKMVSAVAEKKQKKALEYYYELLALKEAPLRILFLLTRQFNLLMQVKELNGKGFDNKAIASKVGIPPFAVGKHIEQAKHFGYRQLKAILEDGLDMEEGVKTGNLTDRMAVELFIVKYSMS